MIPHFLTHWLVVTTVATAQVYVRPGGFEPPTNSLEGTTNPPPADRRRLVSAPLNRPPANAGRNPNRPRDWLGRSPPTPPPGGEGGAPPQAHRAEAARRASRRQIT